MVCKIRQPSINAICNGWYLPYGEVEVDVRNIMSILAIRVNPTWIVDFQKEHLRTLRYRCFYLDTREDEKIPSCGSHAPLPKNASSFFDDDGRYVAFSSIL